MSARAINVKTIEIMGIHHESAQITDAISKIVRKHAMGEEITYTTDILPLVKRSMSMIRRLADLVLD